MQRLLYHAPDNPSQESPFDRAIVQVVQAQAASIVSPYIGLQYLHRLIGMSKSWRLISDVLEWLSATPPKERSAVYGFLKEHEGLVHHYPAIHAKTVVSRAGAYTGSANLTDAGVLRRTEFGVLLTDADQVREIQQWFDAIWAQTSPPPLQSVLELIAELNQISHIAADFVVLQTTTLESDARRVRAKLVKILGHEPQPVAAQHTNTNGAPHAQPAPEQAPSPKVPKVQPSLPPPISQAAPSSLTSPGLQLLNMPAPAGTFDLEEEIAAYVASNARAGFTFADLHQAMRRKSPALTMRETYVTILESCASHPRALFLPDAINRLVYSEGRFVQSNRELLTNALKPVDEMVSQIIEHLSFDDDAATKLADLESQLAPISVLRVILVSMVRSGFVAQVQAGLKLVSTATWSPRLRLLERAHSRWSSRLNAHSSKRTPVQTTDVEPSQVSANPLQATAAALSIEHTEDEVQSQEALIERRSAQLDTFFSYLAEMRAQNGEKTKIGLSYLKTELMRMSGLSESDVSRLLNGTFHMYRSPFLAFVTEARGTVSIVADLEANPHLETLPKTRTAIKKFKVLQALETPSRPQPIPLGTVENKPVKTSIDRLKDVDRAYLQIAQWIFQNNPSTAPMNERRMLTLLSASGVSRETLRRLLLDQAFRFARLFSLQSPTPGKQGSSSRTLRLQHDKLLHYPNTGSFLKTVVWPSGTKHAWLPAPVPARALTVENSEKLTINELVRKSSERDKNYARLIAYIEKRIPHFDRFKSSDALVSVLNGTGIERFVIKFLLGIGHEPPIQLMRLHEDAYGLFLQIAPGALHSYPKSRKLIETPVPEGSYCHPWLTDNASVAARPAPASAPALPAPLRSASPAFAPLIWDDGTRFEIDTLYVALARIFVERADAVRLTPEKSAQMREASVEKYLKICDIRKSSGKTHEPVLSLEIHGGAEKQVELVIHRGYKDYIHLYPKLQRYLVNTSLKLREV